MSLKEEIIKSVVDKLLIGLLLAGAGLGGSLLIEQYKASSSVDIVDSNEFMKRVELLWAKVYEYEADAGKLTRLYGEYWLPEFMRTPTDALPGKIDQQKAVLEAKRAEFFDILGQHAFYLGDELIGRMAQYIGLVESITDGEWRLIVDKKEVETWPDRNSQASLRENLEKERQRVAKHQEITELLKNQLRFGYAEARRYSLGQTPQASKIPLPGGLWDRARD